MRHDDAELVGDQGRGRRCGGLLGRLTAGGTLPGGELPTVAVDQAANPLAVVGNFKTRYPRLRTRDPEIDVMPDDPSILSHVSVGTDDMLRAIAFYEPVLATLGIGVVERIALGDIGNAAGPEPGSEDIHDPSMPVAVAFGKQFPEFWVNLPANHQDATVGNGTHVGFVAESRAAVDAFHAAALAAGARDDGAPGERPHYGAPYYGCFVHDLDGHKIEAMFWDLSMQA